MRYNRILPLLIPVLVLFFLEFFFINPKMIYVMTVLIVLSIFFVTRQFARHSDVSNDWWNFMILPTVFSLSLITYSTIITSGALVHIFFIGLVIFLYLYFRSIYYYLLQPKFYKDYSLENISAYANFLVVFMASASAYGLESFLNIPVWILIMFLLAIIALVLYQSFWVNGIDMRQGFIYIMIGCLVLVELAWSISFLPLNFNISGVVLAICFYLFQSLVKLYLQDILDYKLVKKYLFFSGGSILLILLTARWM